VEVLTLPELNAKPLLPKWNDSKKQKKTAREEAIFAGTEGQGISEAASFTFGDEDRLRRFNRRRKTRP